MCALVDLEPGVKQTPSFWLTQIRFPGVMFYRGVDGGLSSPNNWVQSLL